jgi:dUTP pyrophosphatase
MNYFKGNEIMNLKVEVKRINSSDLPMPKYMTEGSVGMDLYAAVKENIIIKPGEIVLIPTGLAMKIPSGYEGQIRPRSGLALKNGITVLNTPGTIDNDYRGEIKIILINYGKDEFTVKRGDRIAQIVFCPVVKANLEIVSNLDVTERGGEGFGHTGVDK